MITILPLREQSVLTELNAKEGVDAHHAYCFYDGKEMQGYLLYSICGKQGNLLASSFANENMLDGLVRSVFASLLEANVDSAVFSDRFDIATLHNLKIHQENDGKVVRIGDIFHNCNSCKNCTTK